MERRYVTATEFAAVLAEYSRGGGILTRTEALALVQATIDGGSAKAKEELAGATAD